MLKLHKVNQVLDFLLIAIVSAALAIAIGQSATGAASAADSFSPSSAFPVRLQDTSATAVTAGTSLSLKASADDTALLQQARRRDGSCVGTPRQSPLRMRDGSCGMDGATNGAGGQRRNGPRASAGVFAKSAATQRGGAACSGGQRLRFGPGAVGSGYSQGSRRGSAGQASARGYGANQGSQVNAGHRGRSGSSGQANNRQQRQGQQRGAGSSGGQARGHCRRGGSR